MSTFPLPDTANADFGTVYPVPDGSLWVAGTRLYRINAKRDRSELVEAPAPGIRVRSVFRDRTGALWIGTEGDGVFRTANGQQVQYTKKTGLVNDFVRAFLESRDGSVWIGTDEGITRWHEGTLTNYLEPQGLAYFSIRTLAEDRSGDIWIGTERGVSHWRQGRFVRDAVTTRLRLEKIWAIHEDRDGELWFGTRGGGLFRARNGKVTEFGTAQGLPATSIFQILRRMPGVRSGSAVQRHFRGVAAGRWTGLRTTRASIRRSHSTVCPTVWKGHPDLRWSFARRLSDRKRRGLVPSNRGPVRIAPLETRLENLPKVVIEQLVLDGRVTPVDGRVVAAPGEGKLQIVYAAIRLRSQERIRFRYILENYDSEWTEALRRREAFYNLPPGRYRFRVQAFEMNMPDSVSEASIEIEWRPHFYRTAWFLAACIGLLLAGGLAAYRIRLRQVHVRFRAVLEERNRVAREMHDTVIQGCASVSALLEAVVSIGVQDTGSKRELLDCARTQVRATVDEARRAVWNLRQGSKAAREIGQLLDQIAQPASHASRVPVLFEASGRPVLLDPAVEHDILMVAREAVYNAVQHAKPTEVRLQVHFEDDKICLRVLDDGCGFDPNRMVQPGGEHFGLVGMKERTHRLGGHFNIRSSPGTGTELLVEVPVRSAVAEKLGIDLES